MTFDQLVEKYVKDVEEISETDEFKSECEAQRNLSSMKRELDGFISRHLSRGVNRYQILNALESAYTRHYKTREPEQQEQM
jgi:hypothetical protein